MQVYSIKHLFGSKKFTNDMLLCYTNSMLSSLHANVVAKIIKFKAEYSQLTPEHFITNNLIINKLDYYFQNYNTQYLKCCNDNILIIPKQELRQFIFSNEILDFNNIKLWLLEKIQQQENNILHTCVIDR